MHERITVFWLCVSLGLLHMWMPLKQRYRKCANRCLPVYCPTTCLQGSP